MQTGSSSLEWKKRCGEWRYQWWDRKSNTPVNLTTFMPSKCSNSLVDSIAFRSIKILHFATLYKMSCVRKGRTISDIWADGIDGRESTSSDRINGESGSVIDPVSYWRCGFFPTYWFANFQALFVHTILLNINQSLPTRPGIHSRGWSLFRSINWRECMPIAQRTFPTRLCFRSEFHPLQPPKVEFLKDRNFNSGRMVKERDNRCFSFK